MDHRRARILRHRLLQGRERPRRVEGVQPRDPLDIVTGRFRGGRPQGLRLLDLLRRQRGDTQGIAQLLARARDQVQQPGRSAELHQGDHGVAVGDLDHPQVDADLLLDGQEGADDDQVGAERVVQPLEVGGSEAPGIVQRERAYRLRHPLPTDHPHLAAGRQLGGQHLGEGGLEPARVRAGREALEVEHGDRPADALSPHARGGRLRLPRRRAEVLEDVGPGDDHQQRDHRRPGPAEQAVEAPGRRRRRRSHWYGNWNGSWSGRRHRGRRRGRRRPQRERRERLGGQRQVRLRHHRDLGGGGGGALDPPQLAGERVPLARDGDDEAVVVRPLPQALAQGEDVLRQVRLGDEDARPDPFDQLRLLHHLAGPLQQGEEDREGLGRDRHRLAGAQQEPADGVDAKRVKLVQHPLLLFGTGNHRHNGSSLSDLNSSAPGLVRARGAEDSC